MSACLLALLASFSWGTSDFIAGVVSRRTTAWGVAIVGQTIAAVGSLAVLAVLSPAAPASGLLVVLALGGVSSAIGVVAQYRALTLIKMNIVSPIIAGAAVVPVLWGLANGERLQPLQLIGVIATLAGVVLISRSTTDAHVGTAPVRRSGVVLAVAAAIGVGLMLAALDYGGDADPYWTVAAVRCSATLSIGVAVSVVRPRLHLDRAVLPLLLVVGLLIAVANAVFTAAATMADLSVVAVLGWLGPVVTIIWARVILKERLRGSQWLMATMVLVGIVCLAA